MFVSRYLFLYVLFVYVHMKENKKNYGAVLPLFNIFAFSHSSCFSFFLLPTVFAFFSFLFLRTLLCRCLHFFSSCHTFLFQVFHYQEFSYSSRVYFCQNMVIERSNINRTHPHNFQLAFIPFYTFSTFPIFTPTHTLQLETRTHTHRTNTNKSSHKQCFFVAAAVAALAAHSIRVAAAAAACLLSLSPRRPRGRSHGELAHVAHGRLRFELDQRYVLGRQTLVAAPFGVHLRLDDVECRLR